MRLKVYSIRDSKGEMYHQPFYQKTHGEAERSFMELVKDNKSFISKYPDDYDLWYLGEWDDQLGLHIPLETPLHVQKAAVIASRLQGMGQGTLPPQNQAESVLRSLNQ